MFSLRDIKIGVKNLIRWFGIIWNDRDWDYQYIFRLLRFKISNMEEYFRLHGHYIGSKKDAYKMKICYMLLDRIIKDDYSDIAYKFFDKKWGSNVNEDGYLDIKYPNVKTELEEIVQKKDLKQSMELEAYLIKQDIDWLFKYLNKHIYHWSD